MQLMLIPKNTTRFMGFCLKRVRSIRVCKKGQKAWAFDKYASRILTAEDASEVTNRFALKSEQTRFQSKRGKMSMVTIEKCEFGQLNDKRYTLPHSICSLPYGHPDLKQLTNYKDRLMITPQDLIKNHEKSYPN